MVVQTRSKTKIIGASREANLLRTLRKQTRSSKTLRRSSKKKLNTVLAPSNLKMQYHVVKIKKRLVPRSY